MTLVELMRNGRTLEIGLNSPYVNSIDGAFSREIPRALKQLKDDAESSVGIVHSLQPKAFSAGWDLKGAVAGSAGGNFRVTDDHGQDIFGVAVAPPWCS